MKHKEIKAVIIAAMMIFCGCGEDITADMPDIPEQTELADISANYVPRSTIEGIAMVCTNGTVFIWSDCNGGYHELSPISMSAADNDGSIFNGIATGDRIKAEIELVEESYPAHTYVYGLEKTGSGSIDDIPAELMARLEGMGYTAEANAPAGTSRVSTENTELCMIDGVVYYNTGKTNNVPRCGMADGMFDEVIAEGEYPTKDGQANFSAYGFQWGMKEHTVEVCIDNNWYVFEPLDIPSVNEPTESYPYFKYDSVSRITVTPGSYIPMGKDPIEVSEGTRQDLAKLIEICEAEYKGELDGVLKGSGYTVTVYDSDGKYIVYEFWGKQLFTVDGVYYRFTETSCGENITNDIAAEVREAEETEKNDEIKVDEITPLSKEEDLQLRTDYAAYVSARNEGRQVSAEDVHGEFYFGTYDGYKIVVMCPYDCYTCDIRTYKLRYTDEDIKNPSIDLYPYIDVDLPSGSFEMLACKDGTFIPADEAIEAGYIDYSVSRIIGDYMDAYYQGNRQCAYNISCWR